ncbi:hypothetical protein MRB53_002412 [Persea americana]|uniref:Uncharacterized protein n=1 Tax=Persea americana TaxID=3435 RepID=A0ACC2MUI9_PERAE|nr:hypothetical protein MRB53_002412 [Persea americana]
MKKQYVASKKLLNQTGIGYNEDTHIVTIEPERWEEYLKANPDAKLFRTKPLQFPKEMAILFGGTMATGEAAWTPAFGTILDDMLRMPSENHNLSFASNLMSPQSSNFQEEDQEIGLEDQLEKVRRKRPCPSRPKKNSGNDALVVSIDNLVSSVDSTFKTNGPTIAECIASLKKFPNVPIRLYIYALNAFHTKENREVSMSEDDDRIRTMWLKANANGGFVA